jgi:hypothetical protein
MAKNAAELRALVNEANNITEEGDNLIRQAMDKYQQAASAYLAITDKQQITTASLAVTRARENAEQALVATLQARDSANSYSATI